MRSRLWLIILLFAAHGIYAQQPATPQTMRLSKIEVTGLERYRPDQVIATSRLRIGQSIDLADLGDAANRLMSSGLFTQVSYRYLTTADQVEVTFQVAERADALRVVFDNFVW